MSCMNFVKGMGAGLVVGACVGMALAPDKKSTKKTMSKAAKVLETIVSGVTDIISG